jgi:hypothetical protein
MEKPGNEFPLGQEVNGLLNRFKGAHRKNTDLCCSPSVESHLFGPVVTGI